MAMGVYVTERKLNEMSRRQLAEKEIENAPLRHIAEAHLPTRFGDFMLHIFRDAHGFEHMAIVAGEPENKCLVRIHSECATGDIFGSLKCDCRDQLETSLKKIAEAGQGLLIYLRGHEGRGIGLGNKIRAYALQDGGMNTVEANLRLGFPVDDRDYDSAVGILQFFGLNSVRLLTNNREKIEALESSHIHIIERVPLWTSSNPHNEDYILTKQKVLGHLTGCQK